MLDRGAFWSPVPDWRTSSIDVNDFSVRPVQDIKAIWVVSGDLEAFLRHHGESPILGPRQTCPAHRYRLRLAKDRLIHVSDQQEIVKDGWSPDGYALSDISDGMIVMEILGMGAETLMADGCAYDFWSHEDRPLESAMMIFAGIKLVISKREHGWRLHVERAMAAALWRWLLSATK